MANRITQYGIEADERQQLEHLKANSRAFKAIIWMGFVGALVARIVFHDDRVSIVLAVLTMAGLWVHEYYLNRSGWDEHVREQIGRNPEVRRRALRSIAIRSALIGTLWFLDSLFAEGRSLTISIITTAISALLFAITSWWLETKRKFEE